MWDRASAIAFAEKALVAAEGRAVPDNADAMPLDARSRAEIRDAHRMLQVLRASGADEVSPRATGQAIARLDCWNEQANEGFQDSHIGFCKHSFGEYVAESARTLKAAGLGHSDVVMGARSFSVTFPLGSAIPKTGGDHVIAAAARHALSKDDLRIVLGGHADRSGSAGFNQRLSAARAERVCRNCYKSMACRWIAFRPSGLAKRIPKPERLTANAIMTIAASRLSSARCARSDR